LSRNSLNLTDQSKENPAVRPPYKWDEISETAKHYEILTVVNNAGPHTRPYYNLGYYRTNVNEENWVARWYLWHSFRYRFVQALECRFSALTDRVKRQQRQPSSSGGEQPPDI
jgi:hypothetical protein